MFEIEWKTPHNNILVEFLNNWKLDLEHNIIKVVLRDEQRIINNHVLVEVFKIYHIGKIEVDQAKMFDARVTLADITNKVLDIYNNNEGWVVKKMRSSMLIELLPFCQLFTKWIRCNILTISLL
jgi:hypothetical protein